MSNVRKIDAIAVPISTDAPGLSASIDLVEKSPVGIKMPSAWTAGNLTFQVSFDNSAFGDMRDAAGGEYTVSADTDIFIVLDPKDFVAVQYLKIRSGISGTPVVQVDARVLGLITRRIE
jgi:hypothetical protein